MRVEKIEIRILFVSAEELNKLADRMEKSFETAGKFTEEIVFDNGFELEIEMKSDTDKRTRVEVMNGKYTLTTNPWELRRVAATIKARLKEADVGANLTITEYVCSNAVLRIVAEQE